ncbi:MAG: MFS transporter [Deltaproteobacteria bacterium]
MADTTLNPDSKLTHQEKQAVTITSLIIALRLLGIFLILPIFSTYAVQYPGATVSLAGIAFGIYALAQSFLQIPFGWASDRFGRKPVILFGLFILALGSVVCGLAENINQLILARVLQGSGAVGAVAMAALGDLTRPQVRAQAFTISGIAIGVSFIVGLLGGPIIASRFGFHSLFYALAALSVFSMIVTALYFPEIGSAKSSNAGWKSQFSGLINDSEIKKLYLASFIIALALNVFLFIYPLSWSEIGVGGESLWKVYLILLLPTALFVFPYVRRAEKRGKLRIPSLLGWVFLVLSFVAYLVGGAHRWTLLGTGIVFFLGHTLFQSLLPAFLTQRVNPAQRGSATGFYNLAGFLGSAVGGMLAGILYDANHRLPIVASVALILIWGWIGLANPPDSDSMK